MHYLCCSIILGDKHVLMREGLALYLEGCGVNIQGQAESFSSLQTELRRSKVDVVISDCNLNDAGSINFLDFCRRYCPETKIIFLTGMQSGILFQQLLAMGANGIVSKMNDISEIRQAIDCVLSGEQYISQIIEAELQAVNCTLTTKEFQVLELVVQGKSNAEIAEILHKGPGTINTHRVNVMKKLEVHSVLELVKFSKENGLFDH